MLNCVILARLGDRPLAATRRDGDAPDTLSFFEQHQGWHVEVRGGTVGIYRAGKRCAPENVATFLEESRAVLRALTGR